MKDQILSILETCFVDYQKDLHPIDRRMTWLNKSDIGGMGTENIAFMINELVKRFATGGNYLEVGVLRGRSLCAAAFKNDGAKCVGIDNFSEYNPGGQNEAAMRNNLSKLNQKNWDFYNGDFRTVIPEKIVEKNIDVYFYDGCHRYQDQLDGLEVMLPYYKEKCAIIVDDVCWSEVARANDDFCKRNPDFKQAIRIAPHDGTYPHGSCNWWNGFEVLYRG